MMKAQSKSVFNITHSVKETGPQILGVLGLVWIVFVHGIFVFLLSLLLTGPYLFSMGQNALTFAWYIVLMSLASSTPPLCAIFIIRYDVNIDGPIAGYIFGGYIAGAIGSLIAVLVKIWLEQPARGILLTPLQWSSLIAVFATAAGIVCMLIAMAYDMATRKKNK